MVKGTRPAGLRSFYIALAVVAVIGVLLIVHSALGRRTVVIDTSHITPNVADARSYVLGSPTAPVKVMEFADFECPACGQFAAVTEPDVRRLVDSGIVRYHYYDFPLSQHRNTLAASIAAACADDQGKFWPMHDRLFAGQLDWNTEATSNPEPVFDGYARAIGLDVSKWKTCFDAHRHLKRILGNRREGAAYHVEETPTFVIGGKMLAGPLPYDVFRAYVDSAELRVAAASIARAADSTTAPGRHPK